MKYGKTYLVMRAYIKQVAGRIRTVNNKVTYSIRHGIRHWKGKILKPKMQNDYKTGYRVSLWKKQNI